MSDTCDQDEMTAPVCRCLNKLQRRQNQFELPAVSITNPLPCSDWGVHVLLPSSFDNTVMTKRPCHVQLQNDEIR